MKRVLVVIVRKARINLAIPSKVYAIRKSDIQAEPVPLIC